MKQLQKRYVGNRHHFNEVKFGSGLVTLLLFGLKVNMFIKEFEIIYQDFNTSFVLY